MSADPEQKDQIGAIYRAREEARAQADRDLAACIDGLGAPDDQREDLRRKVVALTGDRDNWLRVCGDQGEEILSWIDRGDAFASERDAAKTALAETHMVALARLVEIEELRDDLRRERKALARVAPVVEASRALDATRRQMPARYLPLEEAALREAIDALDFALAALPAAPSPEVPAPAAGRPPLLVRVPTLTSQMLGDEKPAGEVSR